MIDELTINQERYAHACDMRAHDERPSTRYRPSLSIDGNQWCALYGENLQDGVAGFGDSPEEAYRSFDKAWVETIPSSNSPVLTRSDEGAES